MSTIDLPTAVLIIALVLPLYLLMGLALKIWATIKMPIPKAPRKKAEEEDPDGEGDELDMLFDMMEKYPVAAGVVQGLAQKWGIDMAKIEARDMAELLKAKKAIENFAQGGSGAALGSEGYL